jgi:hypothetical protein
VAANVGHREISQISQEYLYHNDPTSFYSNPSRYTRIDIPSRFVSDADEDLVLSSNTGLQSVAPGIPSVFRSSGGCEATRRLDAKQNSLARCGMNDGEGGAV